MAQSGRGEIHEICWRFGDSRGPRMKFGDTKLDREMRTGKLLFSHANNPFHTQMAATCSIAAAFILIHRIPYLAIKRICTYTNEGALSLFRPCCAAKVVDLENVIHAWIHVSMLSQNV